jgi:hypothetical protein
MRKIWEHKSYFFRLLLKSFSQDIEKEFKEDIVMNLGILVLVNF